MLSAKKKKKNSSHIDELSQWHGRHICLFGGTTTNFTTLYSSFRSKTKQIVDEELETTRREKLVDGAQMKLFLSWLPRHAFITQSILLDTAKNQTILCKKKKPLLCEKNFARALFQKN